MCMPFFCSTRPIRNTYRLFILHRLFDLTRTRHSFTCTCTYEYTTWMCINVYKIFVKVKRTSSCYSFVPIKKQTTGQRLSFRNALLLPDCIISCTVRVLRTRADVFSYDVPREISRFTPNSGDVYNIYNIYYY